MSSRYIKVESFDSGWKKESKSIIRLKGKWLKAAGFKPGERARVEVTSTGQLVLTPASFWPSKAEAQI